jgi:hypothetical protein
VRFRPPSFPYVQPIRRCSRAVYYPPPSLELPARRPKGRPVSTDCLYHGSMESGRSEYRPLPAMVAVLNRRERRLSAPGRRARSETDQLRMTGSAKPSR